MLSKLKAGIWAKKCHLSQATTIILAQKWHLLQMKGNVYWRKCYLSIRKAKFLLENGHCDLFKDESPERAR
ncbi:hypothetical protein [Draconibacterium sediminis]|uniref:hypothetical protein n=1 Tax=Draconibacterium sediminis TaxID=1544798 RepID=UPI0026EE5D5B|nr:hypothetical protein [Draconibacterium sediminis]